VEQLHHREELEGAAELGNETAGTHGEATLIEH
jgi:hypothetical protein